MGVFDFLRGKPRDPQERQAEILREAQGKGPEPDNTNPEELAQQEEVKRDEDVIRHGGI